MCGIVGGQMSTSQYKPVFRICIDLNADQDLAFSVNKEPDSRFGSGVWTQTFIAKMKYKKFQHIFFPLFRSKNYFKDLV